MRGRADISPQPFSFGAPLHAALFQRACTFFYCFSPEGSSLYVHFDCGRCCAARLTWSPLITYAFNAERPRGVNPILTAMTARHHGSAGAHRGCSVARSCVYLASKRFYSARGPGTICCGEVTTVSRGRALLFLADGLCYRHTRTRRGLFSLCYKGCARKVQRHEVKWTGSRGGSNAGGGDGGRNFTSQLIYTRKKKKKKRQRAAFPGSFLLGGCTPRVVLRVRCRACITAFMRCVVSAIFS